MFVGLVRLFVAHQSGTRLTARTSMSVELRSLCVLWWVEEGVPLFAQWGAAVQALPVLVRCVVFAVV